jgi:hypothetical protein
LTVLISRHGNFIDGDVITGCNSVVASIQHDIIIQRSRWYGLGAVEQILELQETYGVDTFLWNVDFGGQNYDQMHSSLKLFVDEVLPKL